MKPAVVNAWSRSALMPAGRDTGGYRWVSLVILECTRPPLDVRVERGQPPATARPGSQQVTAQSQTAGLSREEKSGNLHTVEVVLDGLACVMAPDKVLVCDGLLHSFEVGPVEKTPCATRVRFFLEHAVIPTVFQRTGLPHLIVFEFPRDALRVVFASRIVVIDPGHGGHDAGFRGPVNLTEKQVTLTVGRILHSQLCLAGARPYLTRREDVYLPEAARLEHAIRRKADCLVRIHTSGERSEENRTYFVRYPAGCIRSGGLASCIREAVLERMGVDMKPLECDPVQGLVVVQVEPLCLTHYADEANFRAPLFQKRLAQSIFNGLMRWYMRG